jgi:putative membrane protein (TIGR04086 family)
MSQTKTATHRRAPARTQGAWGRILKGLIVAVAVSAGGILLFALLMQWLKPSDGVIRVFNQILKLASIVAGVWSAVGRGGEKGLIRGAAVGLLYMGLGVSLYAVLTGQNLPATSYLGDLGMGVAGGGLTGMILSNLSAK